ncbi:sugar-binding transcriptional regulator [Testudinibacter aquarius]|uniref:DNA-binding transcriptional regulator LsrR (DeoR family) n=2 Tax=Testudinibacter aquarius TaxID=1524974 RepID=A0A4R3YAQ1_9PAST|nr:sugar-binding transcriptional regulator [Testudinibacter aquarius]TCV88832.1 DNA-binding transcriptional regulator LsrR (DeoR family) [Testudinibacter aquarius]
MTAYKKTLKIDPILNAAWLYYQEGMNQSDVADKMNVSRLTINKYLLQARERGIIKIELNFDDYLNDYSAINIKNKFKLNNVLIVPDVHSSIMPSKEFRQHMANAGAAYLSDIIEDNDFLGVAWGRTIHMLGNYIAPKRLNNVNVIQMLGSILPQPDFTTIESSTKIAQKLSAKCVSLHVPAIVSNPQLATELMSEPVIQHSFSLLEKCNKALIVVGNTQDSNPLISSGVLSKKEMEIFRDLGAVGVLCGRFYDINGQAIKYENVDNRLLGISLEKLQKIETKIFLSAGPSNFDALIGAIKGNFITDLIIDEDTAKLLINYSL